MTDAIKQISLDVLVAMNTVVKNVRFYPLSSALVMNGMENLHQFFSTISRHIHRLSCRNRKKPCLSAMNP